MPTIVPIQQRRGTAAAWTAANPVLLAGQMGHESDTNKLKIGDGTTAWSALAYFAPSAGASAEPYVTPDGVILGRTSETAPTSSNVGLATAGTGTLFNMTGTNFFNSMVQIRFPAAAGANATSAVNSAGNALGRPIYAGGGPGWAFTGIAGIVDEIVGGRFFLGLVNVPYAASTVEYSVSAPGARIGLMADSTDNQLVLAYCTTGNAATKVVLNGGTGFPASGGTTNMYMFHATYVPGGTPRIDWVAVNLSTGLRVAGSLTTGLPAGLLGLSASRNSAAETTLQANLAFHGMWFGTTARNIARAYL